MSSDLKLAILAWFLIRICILVLIAWLIPGCVLIDNNSEHPYPQNPSTKVHGARTYIYEAETGEYIGSYPHEWDQIK